MDTAVPQRQLCVIFHIGSADFSAQPNAVTRDLDIGVFHGQVRSVPAPAA